MNKIIIFFVPNHKKKIESKRNAIKAEISTRFQNPRASANKIIANEYSINERKLTHMLTNNKILISTSNSADFM